MKNIKVIIPAAGYGKRMGGLTNHTNKALMKIGHDPLIVNSIKKFRALGFNDITVVVGYKKNQMIKEIGTLANCIYNPFFRVSGLLGSFWMAKKYLKGHEFIFSLSDTFFHIDILKNFLDTQEDLKIILQKKKSYTIEDSKVKIRNSKIIQMSKKIPTEQSNGEFGGIGYLSSKSSKYFFEIIENYFDKGELKKYVMDALMELSKKKKIPINYTMCNENQRIEIDSVSDLVKARKMYRLFEKDRIN